MNNEFDSLLRQAVEAHMEETAAALLAQDGDSPPPSRRHQRRMARMLANPLAYARPAWQRILLRAAAVTAALGLTGAALLSIPSVRAVSLGFLKNVYEDHVNYVFTEQGDPDAPALPHLTPAYLPEGYEETTYHNSGDFVIIRYESSGGEPIYFDYMYAMEGASVGVDNEQHEFEGLSYHGRYYDIWVGSTDQVGNILLWMSSDLSISYQLEAKLSIETLLEIADSIS